MSTVKPGRYRHYKGNEYTVLGVAKHSETLEPMVVYRAEYGERGLWVRHCGNVCGDSNRKRRHGSAVCVSWGCGR